MRGKKGCNGMHTSLALINLATVSFWGGGTDSFWGGGTDGIVHLLRHLISFWGGGTD